MRTTTLVGFVPERVGLAGDLRKLRAEAAAAERTFHDRDNHFNEIRMHQTQSAVEDFLALHPELDD